MGQKILFEKIHIPGIKSYDVYRENGGYASVEKALKMDPDAITKKQKTLNIFTIILFAISMLLFIVCLYLIYTFFDLYK